MVTRLVTAPSPDWRLAVVLAILVVMAGAASHWGRLGLGHEHVVAAVRATLQLAVVSTVIAAAIRSLWLSLAFVAVMLLVAVFTASQRIGVSPRQRPWVGAAVAAGALPVIALCLGSGVVPFTPLGIIPIAGILIGGSMSATTLSGRRASDQLAAERGAYEAALALGFTATQAAYIVLEPSAREALIPGLDQTRTVGLVTLPGAFVGVLLGGGTPLQAGAAQILVLVGLMAGQAITAGVLLWLIAEGRVVRRDLVGVYPR